MTEYATKSNDDFLREFDALVNTALLRHNLIHVNVDVGEQDRLLNGAGSSSSSSSSGICDSSHSSFTNFKQRLNFNHEFSESFKIENQSKFFNTSKRHSEPYNQAEPIILDEVKVVGPISLKQNQKPKPLTSITNLKHSNDNTKVRKCNAETTDRILRTSTATNSSKAASLKTFNTKTNLKGNLLVSPVKQTSKFSTSTLRKTSDRVTKKQPPQTSTETNLNKPVTTRKEEVCVSHDDTDLDVSEIVSPFNMNTVKDEQCINQSFLTMSSYTSTSDESLSAIKPCDRKKYSHTKSSLSSASSLSEFSTKGSSLMSSSSFGSYTNHKRTSRTKKKCDCKHSNDELVKKLVSILIELMLVIMLKNTTSTTTRPQRNQFNKKPKLTSLINGLTKSTLTNLIELAQANTLVKSKEMRQFKVITSMLTPHLKQKSPLSLTKNVNEIKTIKPEYKRSKSLAPLKLNQLEIPNIDDPILFIDTIYNQLLANNIQTMPVSRHSFDVTYSTCSSTHSLSPRELPSLNTISINNNKNQDELDTVNDLFYNNNDFSFIDLYSNHTNDLISVCDNTKDIEIKNRLIDWNYDTDAEIDQEFLQATLATLPNDPVNSYTFDNEYLNNLLGECSQLTTQLNQAITPEYNLPLRTPPLQCKYFKDDLNLSLESLRSSKHKWKRSASFSSIITKLNFMSESGTNKILLSNALVLKSNSKVHVIFNSIVKSLKLLLMTKNVVLVPFILFLLNAKYFRKELTSDHFGEITQQPVAASLFAYKALSSVFIPASTLTQICATTATTAATATLNSLIASYKR